MDHLVASISSTTQSSFNGKKEKLSFEQPKKINKIIGIDAIFVSFFMLIMIRFNTSYKFTIF